MHYKINNRLIKSENAAKSNKQQSSFLTNLLKLETKVDSLLDYGCGKLRYSDILVNMSDIQVFSDSYQQLQKKQIIHGISTTVTEFVKKKYPKALTCDLGHILGINKKFDFILCSNVLSAIPILEERNLCIKNIKKLLSKTGRALFVCQYRNSYFSSYENRYGSIKHLDGFIIKFGRNHSFYGILNPRELIQLLTSNGLSIIRTLNKDGSIYVYANSLS